MCVWPSEGTGLIMPCAKFTSAERYLCEALRPYPRIVDHPLWPVGGIEVATSNMRRLLGICGVIIDSRDFTVFLFSIIILIHH